MSKEINAKLLIPKGMTDEEKGALKHADFKGYGLPEKQEYKIIEYEGQKFIQAKHGKSTINTMYYPPFEPKQP